MVLEEKPVAFYAQLPSHPDQDDDVLTVYRHHRRPNCNRHILRRSLVPAAALLLLAAVAYVLYPSDPHLTVVRLHLNHIRAQTSPHPSLDLSIALTLRVSNPNFFSLRYSSLLVSIGYRGRELGFATSDGGQLRARGSSYVDATLELNAFRVVHDVLYLLEDLAKGLILLDTDSKVEGKLGIFSIQVPIKARVSCEILVNTKNQTVDHQDCYTK